jgi:membrane protein YqaA with SNARE-associated domain
MSEKATAARRYLLSFLWGLAEASCFFIVPDVCITNLARRQMDRQVYLAIAWAIWGALLGGTVVYWLACHNPEGSLNWLVRVPGIDWSLVRKVQSQMVADGLGALLLGPLQGIPYKIFAAQWGIARGNLVWFWLVSIPARGIRFVVSAVLVRLVCICGEKRIKLWHQIDWVVLLVFWVLFYFWYFWHFGW